MNESFKVIDSKATTYRDDNGVWLMDLTSVIKFYDGEIIEQVIPKINIMSGKFDSEWDTFYPSSRYMPIAKRRSNVTVTFQQCLNDDEACQYLRKVRNVTTLDELTKTKKTKEV